jgi:general stress protein 26
MAAMGPADVTPNRARGDQLLAAARDTVASAPFCCAATPSEAGGVNVRVVGPIPGVSGDEDWTIWFSTLRSSRKAADIRRSGRLTLAYQRDLSYVALIGRPALFEDRAEIRRRWLESWRVYYPRGPDDPDLIFVRMNVDRIELCVPGVSPEPFGSHYSVVERDADRSWKVVSD